MIRANHRTVWQRMCRTRVPSGGAGARGPSGPGSWSCCSREPGFGGAYYWRRPDPTPGTEAPRANRPEDPRLTYAGPFLNLHPDVAYVGDERCVDCHEEKSRSFRQHPMGRSLLPIARIAARQRYDAEAHNPFEALGTQFLVERHGGARRTPPDRTR